MVDKARELDKKATELRRSRGGWMHWAKVPWVRCSSRRAVSEAPGWRCLYQAPLNSQGGRQLLNAARQLALADRH